MTTTVPILYSYFRSSCSWRVRIALNILQIPHTITPINLLKQEQATEWYRKINPLGTVPALAVPGIAKPLWQSLAIIDFIDKRNVLVPTDAQERAKCLEMTYTIVSEIQPLQNLSVINKISQLAGGGENGERTKIDWILHHNRTKLGIIESMVTDQSQYTVNDNVCLADICLVPQLYSAQRFGINLGEEFPRLLRIAKKLERMEAFQTAHAHSQIDCPDNLKGSIYF